MNFFKKKIELFFLKISSVKVIFDCGIRCSFTAVFSVQ